MLAEEYDVSAWVAEPRKWCRIDIERHSVWRNWHQLMKPGPHASAERDEFFKGGYIECTFHKAGEIAVVLFLFQM